VAIGPSWLPLYAESAPYLTAFHQGEPQSLRRRQCARSPRSPHCEKNGRSAHRYSEGRKSKILRDVFAATCVFPAHYPFLESDTECLFMLQFGDASRLIEYSVQSYAAQQARAAPTVTQQKKY
jgi:hypothetical protein